MYLTISTHLMAYSDFSWQGRPKYAPREEYVEYLERYASFFQLNDGIHFNTEVTGAQLKSNGEWEVTAEKDGEKMVMTADRLIIASGSNHTPKSPPTPGFTGDVVHSSDWRNKEQYAGKRVMIIGNSESSADIAAETAEVAKSVVLWARRPVVMGPRFLNEKSNDELTSMQAMQKGKTEVWEFLETITCSKMSQLQSAEHYSAERLELMRQTVAKKQFDATHLFAIMFVNACENVPDGLKRSDQVFAVPKSIRMITACAQNKLDLVIAKKAKFEGKTITFSEFSQKNFEWPVEASREESYECDVIIACTGFKTDFQWLKGVNVEWNPRTWFKHCIPAGYEDKLAFLGWTRPHQGGIPACSELLSRYLALLWTGQKSLPKNWQEQTLIEKEAAESYYHQAGAYNTIVDYPAFMTSVSQLVGCEPRRPSIFNLKRFIQFYTFPMWPAYYRTQGPGARPELIERELQNHGTFEAIQPTTLTYRRAWRKALGMVFFWNPIFYVSSFFGSLGQGQGKCWSWAKSKKFAGLHGQNMRVKDLFVP
jgi:dimethylaniline monooxygenase (N-oxide forming)